LYCGAVRARIRLEVPGCGCQVRLLISRIVSLLCTDFASRLEERRKVKSAAYYERKKAVRRTLATAKKEANVDESVKEELAKYGY
jgi:hypothetical protein